MVTPCPTRGDQVRLLTTQRLLLRELTLEDAPALFAIHREPGVWTYFTGHPPASLDEERAHIKRVQASYRQHGFGFWATVLRQSGELIGRCGLLSQTVDGQSEIEMAYLLSPRFWGRGLASEAARAIRDLAFQRLPCSRLISLIHPDNTASKRVALAAGFRFHRKTLFGGREADLYSMQNPGVLEDVRALCTGKAPLTRPPGTLFPT